MQTEKRILYEQTPQLPKSMVYPPSAMYEAQIPGHYGLEEQQIQSAMLAMGHPGFRMPIPPQAYSKMSWRKGKWLDEEEAYTKKLIEAFNAGYLNIPSGTTLRSFLSERLSCDPMRITKKFAGSSCIGKQVYSPCDPKTDTSIILNMQEELKVLEEKFKAKVDMQRAMDYYPITPQSYAAAMQGHMPIMPGMEMLPPEYYAALHAQASASAYYPSHYSMMKGYTPAEIAALQSHMAPYYLAQQKMSSAPKYRDITELPYAPVSMPPNHIAAAGSHFPLESAMGLNAIRMKPAPTKEAFEPNGVILSQSLKANLATGIGLESALMAEAKSKATILPEPVKPSHFSEEELKRIRKYSTLPYDGIPNNPMYLSTVPANKPSIVKDLKETIKEKVESPKAVQSVTVETVTKEEPANDKEASDLLINFFKTAQSRDSLPDMLTEAKKAASEKLADGSSPLTDTEEQIGSSSESSCLVNSESERSIDNALTRKPFISLNDSSHDQFILSCKPPTHYLATFDPAMLTNTITSTVSTNKRKLEEEANELMIDPSKKVKV